MNNTAITFRIVMLSHSISQRTYATPVYTLQSRINVHMNSKFESTLVRGGYNWGRPHRSHYPLRHRGCKSNSRKLPDESQLRKVILDNFFQSKIRSLRKNNNNEKL